MTARGAPEVSGTESAVGSAVASRPAPMLALLALLGGCVTVDSTLRNDGTATITMTYRTPPDATEFLEKRRYSSPHVTVESVKIYEDQTTILTATVDDVTKLSTAEGFRYVRVDREPAGDAERLAVTIENPNPTRAPKAAEPAFTISVTLPGPVRCANHDADVSDARVMWRIPPSEYSRQRATVLRVKYAPRSAGAGDDRAERRVDRHRGPLGMLIGVLEHLVQ